MRSIIVAALFSLCTSSLFAGHVNFLGTLTNTGGVAAGSYLTNGDTGLFWFDYVGAAGGNLINVTGYNPDTVSYSPAVLQGFFAEGSHQSSDPFTWQGVNYTGTISNSAATLGYSSVPGTSATAVISFTQKGEAVTFLPNYFDGVQQRELTMTVSLTAVGTGQSVYDGTTDATEENLHMLFRSSDVTGTITLSYSAIGQGTVVVDSASFSGHSWVPEPSTWGLFAALGGVFCVRQYRRFKK